MEHICSNKDMGLSQGLWLDSIKGKMGPQILTPRLIRNIGFQSNTPHAVVLNLASYQNPRDSLDGNPSTRLSSSRSLWGWDPGISRSLSFPGDSHEQPRSSTTLEAGNSSTNRQVPQPGQPCEEGGLLGIASSCRSYLSLCSRTP